MGRRQRGVSNCFSKYVIGLILLCLIVIFSYSISYSGIVTDGTVGWGGALTGPKFIIPESLGTRSGNNLFQSFSTFNIYTGESATFTGSSSIENVIARITGGTSSYIDGKLSCSISGANLYLINPSGVMFGNNATLDVKGSFYVSTADYLKLSDGGRYDAKTPSNSILTSAPPSAFGFLTGNPAGVTVNGALLEVPAGKTISIAAGDINIKNGYLYAPGGQITLASVASTGEALLTPYGINADGFSALGNINITQTDATRKTINGIAIGNLDVSNQKGGSGSIYVRGGKFVIDKGHIYSDTYGDTDGGGINVNISGDMAITNGGTITSDTLGKGNAGNINIETKNLNLSDGGMIGTFAHTGSTGNAGDINIKATDSINISGNYTNNTNSMVSISGIYSQTFSEGDSGSVNIETKNLNITNAGTIQSITRNGSLGNSGNITIKASDSINISGYLDSGNDLYTSIISSETNGKGNAGNITIKAWDSASISGFYANAGTVWQTGIYSDTSGIGNAGNINIETRKLSITNIGRISTIAKSGSTGNAGNITIKASDAIYISDYFDSGEGLYASSIVSETNGSGNAGDISIVTNRMTLENVGIISTGARKNSTGNAGNIYINTSNSINVSGNYVDNNGGMYSSGIKSQSFSKGNAGNINLETNVLNLAGTITTSAREGSTGNGGNIKIRATNAINISGYTVNRYGSVGINGILSNTYGSGNAGYISIETGTLNIANSGEIATSSGGTGNAGSITINALDSINISGYWTNGVSAALSGIYSNTTDAGNAGNINIITKI